LRHQEAGLLSSSRLVAPYAGPGLASVWRAGLLSRAAHRLEDYFEDVFDLTADFIAADTGLSAAVIIWSAISLAAIGPAPQWTAARPLNCREFQTAGTHSVSLTPARLHLLVLPALSLGDDGR
jgi:hypothetical protein